MELRLQLALKGKPMARCLLNEEDEYLSSTVVETLNDFRLFGHTQILVHSSFGERRDEYEDERSERMEEAIVQLETQLKAMVLGGETVNVVVTLIDNSSRRVDVTLCEKK